MDDGGDRRLLLLRTGGSVVARVLLRGEEFAQGSKLIRIDTVLLFERVF